MKLLKYKLENGSTPFFIKDGGYFPNGDYLLGFGEGEPEDIEEISKEAFLNIISSTFPEGIKDEITGENKSLNDLIIIYTDFYNSKVK